MLHLLGDLTDLGANLRADVRLDQVVDLIESRQLANGGAPQTHLRMDQKLLCQLDDRAVRAADVLARTSLRSQP